MVQPLKHLTWKETQADTFFQTLMYKWKPVTRKDHM